MTSVPRWTAPLVLLAACTPQHPDALGTLEYDRITVPAPASERIVSLPVHEGKTVQAGTVLMQLDAARAQAQTDASTAEVARQRSALDELQAGPRREEIEQARAQLAAAEAQAREADATHRRLQPLAQRQLVAAIDLDRARAAAQTARAQAESARQALDSLRNGTRSEQLSQAQAALAAAEAQTSAQRTTLGKYTLTAPRDGRIDSLPYKLGDQPPAGASLAVLLVGDAPYVRLYVPEPLRANVAVGDAVQIRVDGREQVYRGQVRMIRSEAAFTPYFALAGADAARLSYLAEVQLGADAAQLPAGLPASAMFERKP